MGKILAFDFGTKRIGYAVSDMDRKIAFPRGVLATNPKEKLMTHLRKIIAEEGISKIILGVALDIENRETDMSKKARRFGEDLARAFMLPVEYVDETRSTDEALSKIPFRKERAEKGYKDAVAAQIILQRYLDAA